MTDARRMATNVVVGWIANIVKVCVQLVMIPLMARLLGPAEMGLYALTVPIMSFVFQLADAGLGNSLAREPAENHRIWSSAFWALQAMGVVLMLGVSGSGFVIGAVAHQPRLPLVMMALSTIFLMVASAVLPMARLTQKGRLAFAPMADMFGNLLGAGLGVWCAFHGYGVWSMVAQYVSSYFFRTVVLNVTEFYLPRFHFDVAGLKTHVQMGGAITVTRLIDFGGRIIENTQIARVLGAVALGGFGFANQVSRFLCESASNSIWANLYYAGLHGDEAGIRTALMRLSRLLGLVLFPVCAVTAAAATTVLPRLLGHNWAGAAWPVAILCAFTPFSVLGSLTSAILYAKGYSRVPVWGTVFQSVGRLLVVLAAPWLGLDFTCLGLGLVLTVQGAGMILFTRDVIGHSARQFYLHLRWPLFFSVAGAGLVYLALHTAPNPAIIVLSGLAFAFVYVAGQFLLDRELFMKDLTGLRTLARAR
jgi:PST family polysaccharide transporter